MSELERVKAENAELRQQVEKFRQRELSGLNQQLAEARHDVAHYKSEAERNASIGRQIDAEYRGRIRKLEARLQAAERINVNVRQSRPTA